MLRRDADDDRTCHAGDDMTATSATTWAALPAEQRRRRCEMLGQRLARAARDALARTEGDAAFGAALETVVLACIEHLRDTAADRSDIVAVTFEPNAQARRDGVAALHAELAEVAGELVDAPRRPDAEVHRAQLVDLVVVLLVQLAAAPFAAQLAGDPSPEASNAGITGARRLIAAMSAAVTPQQAA